MATGADYGYDGAGRLSNYEGALPGLSSTFPAYMPKYTNYAFNANGNVTARSGQGLVWDVQNRLYQVTGTTNETYLYDPAPKGHPQRVKKTVGSTVSLYPFAHYEITGSTVTKYYFFAGMRIAMKQGSTLTYLHSDHLGSTVLETNTSGNPTADQKYRAYGKQRDAGAVVTDHKFTGQKLDGTGLQYYNARYYDPAIGVFISPDAIIPDPTNVFGYNRYMYVAGNPLRLTDSSGHFWDTVADVVSIGYDIYEISQNGLTWETGGALAADVAGAAVPFMPAPGACLRWCDDVAQYSDEAWEGAQQGWNATKRFFGYGDEAAQYGDDAAAAAKAGADCLTNSFSGDTLVMTAGGAKPIAELVEGDLVLAYNEATGKVGPYPIVDTISHIDPEIVLLTIDGELIETTAEHPFYEMESAPWLTVGELQGRWTDAIDLVVGDLVGQADGTTGVVQSVEVVARQQRMYNLTVDVAHTFFVGSGQWLVHNCIKNVFSGRRAMLTDMTERGVRGANGFTTTQNGKQFYTINNQDVLNTIQETFGSARDWVKVYEDGFDAAGNKVSLHYFHNTKTGQAWDGKIKSGWSNPPKNK